MRFGKKENNQEGNPVDPVRVFEPSEQRRAEASGNTFEGVARPEIVATVAVIGQTICIKGEVTGDEDLLVEGRVEGTVSLPKNRLMVGANGNVAATIKARSLNVEGHIEGDVNAVENVVVTSSGIMQGNIKAPRVTLQDGCKFKGTIDMDLEPSSVVTDLKSSFTSSTPKRNPDQQAI